MKFPLLMKICMEMTAKVYTSILILRIKMSISILSFAYSTHIDVSPALTSRILRQLCSYQFWRHRSGR